MADTKFRRLRVLHLVSADGQSAPNPLLVPLLARGNRQRIESQVLSLSPGDARLAVVRQSGLPVHEVALSRQRFSLGARSEAKKVIAEFKPDVLHAWGSTAQLLARFLVGNGKDAIPLVWSVTRTTPRLKSDGWLDNLKFDWNVRFAPRSKRIVYPSAAAAANYRRAGLPDGGVVIAPGVDAERFKPDEAARVRVREQIELPKDAVVVGMYGPFQPEFDHGTFLKAIGELVRINSNLYCVLAGRGTVKGNSALSAMVGGGTLGTRTRVIGEWTDLSALFNACDVVCSTATTDAARLTLAMSMLCGTMCVATGVGAQGEVVGGFGATVEPGSPDAMTRGIRRILEMPTDRKAYMSQQARNHILQNFNMARSIEKYHELYVELVSGEAPAAANTVTANTVTNTNLKDATQSAAAQIIASRVAATSVNTQKPAAQPAVEQSAQEPATGFGSVAQSAESVKARVAERPAFTESAVAGIAAEKAANKRFEVEKDDSINFDALATAKVTLKPVKAAPKPAEPVNDSMPWSDDEASLLDGILVEADPVTAKANADKAAAAAKSAANKAATNAAFAAALAANPDSAKGMDPRMLAALNLGGGHTAAPRPVAGKAPPQPTKSDSSTTK